MGALGGYKGGGKAANIYDKYDSEYQKAVESYNNAEIEKGQTDKLRQKRFDEWEKNNPDDLSAFNHQEEREKAMSYGGALVGGHAGAIGGYWISNYICNKFNIK